MPEFPDESKAQSKTTILNKIIPSLAVSDAASVDNEFGYSGFTLLRRGVGVCPHSGAHPLKGESPLHPRNPHLIRLEKAVTF